MPLCSPAGADGRHHDSEMCLRGGSEEGLTWSSAWCTCAAAAATWSSRSASSISPVLLWMQRAASSSSLSCPSSPYTVPAARYTCRDSVVLSPEDWGWPGSSRGHQSARDQRKLGSVLGEGEMGSPPYRCSSPLGEGRKPLTSPLSSERRESWFRKWNSNLSASSVNYESVQGLTSGNIKWK